MLFAFLLFASKTLESKYIRLILILWSIIFSFFLFPLYGIPFAEPARPASILAPFSAILFGLAIARARMFFKIILLTEGVAAYYFLTDYAGLGREFRLVENLVFLKLNDLYYYSFNSDFVFFIKFLCLTLLLIPIGYLFIKDKKITNK